MQILTIGHSTHPIGQFIDLLRRNQVTALADVRSAPYSRFSPQYNKAALAQSLRDTGIAYVFLGRELGARSDDPACYVDGRVQYARLAQTALFRAGIERLTQGAREHRIALMCAEREPLACHRTLLVARALDAAGIAVDHILPDGRLEPHAATLDRLLALVGLPTTDLYRSHADLIAEALARKETRIAYTREQATTERTGQRHG